MSRCLLWTNLLLMIASPLYSQELEDRIANTVREMGVIEAAESVDIQCRLPGQSTILWVAPEGVDIKKGELLISFDASAIEEQRNAARIEANQQKATLASAVAEYKALKRRLESLKQVHALQTEAAALEGSAALAELELEKQKVQGELRVREAELNAVETKLATWKRQSGGEGPQPPELALDLVASKEGLANAERTLKHITAVAMRRQQAANELAASKLKLRWETESQELERAVETQEAAVVAAEAMTAGALAKVEALEGHLAQSRIVAPRDGAVVYANVRTSRTGGFEVEAGANVRERQTVIRLPDLTSLQVRVGVNETRIRRVRVGQKTEVYLSGAPGNRILGTVTEVSRTPRPTASFPQNNVKEYDVVVRLTDPPNYVRLGMTGVVEIKTD